MRLSPRGPMTGQWICLGSQEAQASLQLVLSAGAPGAWTRELATATNIPEEHVRLAGLHMWRNAHVTGWRELQKPSWTMCSSWNPFCWSPRASFSVCG